MIAPKGECFEKLTEIVAILLHTTALRGNRWELDIPKTFLKPGAFRSRQVQTVSTIKLERRLGTLTADEMKRALGRWAIKNHHFGTVLPAF